MSNALTATEAPVEGQTALSQIGQARASQEIQALVLMAKNYPRDELTAIARIRKQCQRPKLAMKAFYSYPRGQTNVRGPSIRLAEAVAGCWGNLDFGIVEVEQRFGKSTCLAYAWDLETNTRQAKQFWVEHVRYTRDGAYDLKDPRDIYELVANQGARRMRACILGVIPGDVIEEALEEVEATLKKKGDAEGPFEDRLRKLVTAFDKMQVSKDMLEGYLGHALAQTDEHEWFTLQGVWSRLKDEPNARKDYFELDEPEAMRRGRNVQTVTAESDDKPEPKETKKSKPKPTAENSGPPTAFEVYRNEIKEADTKDVCTVLRGAIENSGEITDMERGTLLADLAARLKKVEPKK